MNGRELHAVYHYKQWLLEVGCELNLHTISALLEANIFKSLISRSKYLFVLVMAGPRTPR
jgi:hypothetical protein